MIAQVRRCPSREVNSRRGKVSEPAYKYRNQLTCNVDNFSIKQVDECKGRGCESNGEEFETHRSVLPESWSLSDQNTVVYGRVTAALSILFHAQVL